MFNKILLPIILFVIFAATTVSALEYDELQTGRIYIVSEQTPVMLMPDLSNGIIDVMSKIKYIASGGAFKVLLIQPHVQTKTKWYRVEAVVVDQEGKRTVIGWVNSMVLLGQKLKPYEPKKIYKWTDEKGTVHISDKPRLE